MQRATTTSKPESAEPRWLAPAWAGLLAAVVLAVYLPALSYGLIWDDPRWYGQSAGKPAWQFFTGLASYQFYRPLSLWLNQQFIRPDGTIAASAAHAAQLAAHLAAVLFSAPALRALGVTAWPARLAALLFAASPFAFQAAAWQAPQGPWVISLTLAAVLAADQFQRGRGRAWLGVSLTAYAAALLFQESALPFVFLFFWLALEGPPWRLRRRWPWLHAALAAGYLLIWLNVPRLGGVTGSGFDLTVLAYLLQGAAYPLARLGAPWLAGWPAGTLAAGFALLILALLLGAWRAGQGRAALLAGLWLAAGFAPVWVGLAWAYVEVGERLLYPAALGIALLWANCVAWPRGGRLLGAAALALALGAAGFHLRDMRQLYAAGTRHLQAAESALAGAAPPGTGAARLLFVNFPDRFELRPPYYPLGFWGLTLAPPVQSLADFARARYGRSAEAEALAAFLTGADERAAWPYRVDLLGVNAPPAELLAAASRADQVYLTRYRPDGALELRAVGAARSAADGLSLVADFEGAARLTAADVGEVGPAGSVAVRLTWQCRAALDQGETVFVHVWRAGEFVFSADGDSLGELVPVWEWTPGLEIEDRRLLEATGLLPGEYEVRVGVYNRWDNRRRAAVSPDGRAFTDGAVPVGVFRVPAP